MRCPKCGAENPEGKKFCHEYGSEDIQLFKECENDFFLKKAGSPVSIGLKMNIARARKRRCKKTAGS